MDTINEYHYVKPADHSVAKVRFGRLSSCHVRQNHGNNCIHVGKVSVVIDGRVQDFAQTSARRKKNNELLHRGVGTVANQPGEPDNAVWHQSK
jgi:hypothetical protein